MFVTKSLFLSPIIPLTKYGSICKNFAVNILQNEKEYLNCTGLQKYLSRITRMLNVLNGSQARQNKKSRIYGTSDLSDLSIYLSVYLSISFAKIT